jgi:predicted MFS family arabinose efflux permease
VLGTQIVSTTAGWQLYERTGDPLALAAVGLVELVPVLVLIIPAGNLADRQPRRTIAMFAYALMVMAATGLALLSHLAGPTLGIYALLALIGCARAFAAPSVGTILPQLLSPPEFAAANAYSSGTMQIATVSGPAIGGLLYEAGGGPLAYGVAGIGHLTFIVMLAFVPAIRPPPREARQARDIFIGFRFIRQNRIFLAAITLDMFAVLLGGAVSLLPMIVKDVLHGDASDLGWLRAAPGIGAAAMALLLTRLPPWQRPGRAMMIAVCGFGLATIGIGLSTTFALTWLCLLLTGVFDEISVLVRQTLEQLITPDHLRGRVASINHIFIGFSNQFGAFWSGSSAALLGLVPAIVVGGACSVVVAAVISRAFPNLLNLGPLATLSPAKDPEPVVPLPSKTASR